MTPIASASHRTLIQEAGALVRGCGSLPSSNWDRDLLAEHLLAVERLADDCANAGLTELQAAALDLYVCLSSLANESDAAKSSETIAFAQALERFSATVLAFNPRSGGEMRHVDLLGSYMGVPRELSAGLATRGFALRSFPTVAAMLAAVECLPAAALLVEADLVEDASAALDELTHRVPQAGGTRLIGFGLGEPDARLKALLHGADLFVERLDDAGLAGRIAELIEHPQDDAYRVLVIDDITSTRKYLRAILEHAGMRVQECASPNEVMAQINRFKPDLLLVDLYMPGMDGMSLTMNLRKHAELSTLPIVFLSVEQNEETRFQAIQAGGDDFLTKPVRPRILVAATRSRIKRARLLKRQVASSPEAVTTRGGQLRRGDFLAQLGQVLRTSECDQQVLMSIKVDQADELGRQLGMAAAFELEQAIAQRIASELRAEDAYTLWLVFGFGVLVRRDATEDLLQLAQHLCQAMAATPFLVGARETRLTVSIGLALPPTGPGAGDPDRWFAAAFAGQSVAHRLGGNRIDGVLSREHGEMPAERVLMIREWVKDAAIGNNIQIEFQPMLPLCGDPVGQYALAARLRDLRSPLSGVTRREYLAAARAAGSMAMIDRVALFNALEAIDDQRRRQQRTRILVPLDLASCDPAQLRWLVAELRRRKADSSNLAIEVDADLPLHDPAMMDLLRKLKGSGVAICLADDSGSLTRIEAMAAMPADFLRLPYAAIAGIPASAFAALLAPWKSLGRELIVDKVEAVDAVPELLAYGAAYLQGDVLATSGTRLDYDFTRFGS